MRDNYKLPRLYIDEAAGPLKGGQTVSLTDEQLHYLGSVLRLGAGARLRLFNASDGEWAATLISTAKKKPNVTITEKLRDAYIGPDIWLLFAPIKRERTAFVVEKATELGASRLMPVITEFTQYAKMRLDKMQAQIIKAAEQCERFDLPSVDTPKALGARLDNWQAGRTLIFADEAGGGKAALDALKNIHGPAALLIGPEGGFSDKERARLLGETFVTPISLGPRILRADTAALSVLTLWQAACGDWRP